MNPTGPTIKLKPEMTDYRKTEVATEVAFNALADEARKLGLPVASFKLMYLPTLEVTINFQEACRAVLADLRPGDAAKEEE